MQLTRYSDYSLRVLMYLALASNEKPITIGEIATRFAVSNHHLTKIVHHLGRLGYLETIRGRGGGIRLGKLPAEIFISQVIRDTEPTLNVIDCNNPPCPIRGNCKLKGALQAAQDAFLATLSRYSLEDLTKQPGNALRFLS